VPLFACLLAVCTAGAWAQTPRPAPTAALPAPTTGAEPPAGAPGSASEPEAAAAGNRNRQPVGPASDTLKAGVWQLGDYRTPLGLKPAVIGAGNGYVAFDAGGFRINAGCDTLRGSYWVDDERLLFSPHIASVVGDCPPTLRAQEQAVLALLPAVTRLQRGADELVLLDADAQPLLTLVKPQTSPLQKRVWVLLAYRNRDDTVVPALPAPRFTLLFEDATSLSGVACDEYRGGFVRDERFLALEGPLAGTRLGCAEPAATRQAEDYLAVLSRMDSYRVDAQSLLLRDADGRMIARFAAVEPGAALSAEGSAGRGIALPAAPRLRRAPPQGERAPTIPPRTGAPMGQRAAARSADPEQSTNQTP
jgi:heat shock protein HslJ